MEKEEASLKKESNTRRLLVIAGLVITGLLIGGGLVFAGFKLAEQRRVPQTEPVPGGPTPTPTVPVAVSSPTPTEATPAAEAPTPTPTISPTTAESAFGGWETYTNADYGYQFKHPQGWTFTVDILNEDPSAALYVIRQGIKSNNVDDYHILVHAWDNPEKLTLSEWLQFMKDSNALPLPVEDMDLTSNTKVGGEEALQFWSDPLSGGKEPGKCHQACPVLSVYFVHGDKAYAAELQYLREFDEESFVTFTQVLSTFEFL